MRPNPNGGPDRPDVSRLISIARSAFAREKRYRIWATAALCTGVVLAGFLGIALIEQYAYLSSPVKLSLLGLLIVLAAVPAAIHIRNRKSAGFEQFYDRFSRFASLPSLKHAFDLALQQRDTKLKLYSAALAQNLQQIDKQQVREQLKEFLRSRSPYRKFRFNTAFLALTLCGVVATSLLLPDATWRTAHAWNTYEAPNPYSYTVHPGHVTVEQGSSLSPAITFEGSPPDNLALAFKTDVEEEYRTRPVSDSGQDTIRFSSLTLNTSSSYYIVMDGFSSPVYRAEVQLRPRFEELNARVIPPSYTGLDSSRHSYPFSQVKAYQGSQVVLSGTINKQLSRLTLIRTSKGDSVSIETKEDDRFRHSLEVTERDTFAFVMRDTAGLSNKNTFEFVLEPVVDEPPFVQIVQPESNLEMKKPRDLELHYEATDDFGLTSSHLRYELRRAFSDTPVEGSVRLRTPRPNERNEYTWKLEELDPKPRDVITYWVEVADNNGYAGAQAARSRSLTITFPSLTAYLDELENKETDVRETLDEISDSYRQIRQDYEQFKEELKENPQGDWEQKQSLEDMKEQQKQLNEKVEELNKKFEEIRQEMSRNNVMSDETLKAYDELQELMKEIDDPELLKALEELQNSMGSMDQQKLREALENFEFNEKQYQERINRTIELFKTLKLNSDLEKMATALEELAQQEEELSKSDEPAENKLDRQKAVQEDTKNLSDELEDLPKNSPERSREDVNKLEKESRQQLQDIQKQLEENIRQMENKNGDSADEEQIRNQQKQIQQNFRQMAEQMRDAQQQMGQQRNQINMSALQYILYSLINLSQNQEELTRETEQLNNRSQAFVEKARVQRTITDQFTQLSDSLFKVSSEVPRFSNQINEKKLVIQQQLSSSVEMLAERDKSRSVFAERQALGGINELSTMIASLLDQMQDQQGGGSGGGMSMQQLMEQLQQMSGQQQQMNRQIEELINDIQGDRLSNEQINRLNQLSRQQNQIRKQLREIQQNGGLESGDKVLSELERLSEEMEETINDLRGGQADESLVKRQQNILSRMLNAEKALNERGEEERREGTTAEESPRSTPPDITLEELEKRIRTLLNDPDNTRFSQDYQRLIEQYFELLKELKRES